MGLRALRLRFEDDAAERAFLDDYAIGDRLRHALLWASLATVALAMRLADPVVVMSDAGLAIIRHWREGLTVTGGFAVAAWSFVPDSLWRRTWQLVSIAGYVLCFANVVFIQFALQRQGVPITTEYFLFGCTVLSAGGLIVYSTLSLRLVHAAVAATIPAVLQVVFLLLHPPPSSAVTQYIVFWMASVVSFGAVGGHMIERLHRLDFRRRVQLEASRAQTEAVLTAEVRHQVAARSRELSDVLARAEVDTQATALQIGQTFDDRYVIREQIGEGGMGAVYAVSRVSDDRRLALKIISGHVTSSAAARFAREAEIGARLRHENLVPILDVGIARGVPYLVMDFLAGGSLLARRGRFGDVAWATTIIRQVARGLQALHEAGVIHRDLKPANVLFVDAGDTLKIGDFGISRVDAQATPSSTDPQAATLEARVASPQPLTMTGALIGTPMYMAPECALGARAIQAPADVFAFGMIAYELITGRAPFATPPLFAALAGAEAKPAAIGDDRFEWIMRCLETAPERRPSIADVLRDLRA